MCGIVGHISGTEPIDLKEIEQACVQIQHRGPDGHGVKLITEKIAFGHTRLAFLDLGEHGAQPMSSQDEDIWISYNGEIYNFLEIKAELQGHYQFQSGSDTEVILAAYKQWGIEMLSKFKGMFAFALLDKTKHTLYLVRDPFGIKPLYYHLENKHLIFASELKAIDQFEVFKRELDFSSFCDFFVYRYIPSPKTIWKNTFKIPPAHYLKLDTQSFALTIEEYWHLDAALEKIEDGELVTSIGETLEDSIRTHSRADVPIGSFLSGGYDSSAIAYYLKKNKYFPATFSIGFSNWGKSEDYFASIVAKHLGLSNKSVVADEESLKLIDKMPSVYDEPIADISIIPTFMVSQLASTEMKAVMSGEGADELFGGYHWQKEFYAKNHPSRFIEKVKNLISKPDPLSFYTQAMSMGGFDKEELKRMLNPRLHQYIPEDIYWFYKKHLRPDLSPLKQIQYLDMKCFMGELVLTKVDRASMANSLEVRVPFLDTRLFEKVFQAKEDAYFKPNMTKYLLYENIKEHLPQEILSRSKQGFVGPDSYYMNKDWYRKELKNSCLVKDKVIEQSYIDALLNLEYDWKIWKILVMEKWYATWMS